MSSDVLIGLAETIVATVFGGGITWFVSHRYFKRSGDELRAEARELRKLTNLALVVITDPKGRYEPVFDVAGMITGLKVQLEAQSLAAGRGRPSIGTPPLSTAQQPPSQNGE
jgi:hypothetical protein